MRRVLQKGIVVNRNLVIMVRFANVNRSMTTNNISSVLCNDYMCNMKRKSTLVDSVSAEPEVSAVGRKRLLSLHSRLSTLVLIVFCLFFGGKAWGQTTNQLLSENFDAMSSISTSYSANDWYAYNAGSGNNWTLNTDSDYAHSGSKSASYTYSSSYAANCYLVSAPFTVSSNMTELSVSLYECVRSSTWTETFDVFFVKASDVTTAAAVASATKYNAISSASYTNTTYAQKSGSVSSSALAGQSVRVVVHCTSAADQWNLYIDDIVVSETAPTCPAPTSLASSNVTSTSASLSWSGSADSYNIRYTTIPPQTPFSYDFESAEAWSVDNVSPCTTYDGDGTQTYAFSNWTFTNQYYTGACIVFNNDNAGSNMQSHSGEQFGAMFNPGSSSIRADDWFILPELTIQSGGYFRFWCREITDQYGAETINVGVYGGNGTFSSTIASNVSVNSTTWTQKSYSLSAYAGQTIRLAIQCTSLDIFGVMIDDITVDGTLFLGGTSIANVSSPYTISGLSPGTTYYVQVQSNCGGSTSGWSNPINFTTPLEYAAQWLDDQCVIDASDWCEGETRNVTLKVKNIGGKTWYTSAGGGHIAAGGHPEQLDGTEVVAVSYKWNEDTWYDSHPPYTRVEFTGNVAPGETGTVTFPVQKPSRSGPNVLKFNLIRREAGGWFSSMGYATEKAVPINVSSPTIAVSNGDNLANCLDGSTQVTLTTTINNEVAFPFEDDFESGLGNWEATYTTNSTYQWTQRAGTNYQGYNTANGGSNNAGVSYTSDATATYAYLRLKTDLSAATGIKISFWYMNPYYSSNYTGDYDYLYLERSTDGSSWEQVSSYSSTYHNGWTQVSNLSIPDGTKYIRFSAYMRGGNYGAGVAVDDVRITGTAPSPTWTYTGTPGIASGATYTVTPSALHNTYTVSTGNCSSSISFDVPRATNISVSPSSPSIDCGSTTPVEITASGIDGASYYWNGSSTANSTVSASALTQNENYYVNATLQRPFNTIIYDVPGSYSLQIPSGVNEVLIEAWGAQGGGSHEEGRPYPDRGGKGGYSKGYYKITSPNQTLYVCVGGRGTDGIINTSSATPNAAGGYNGGGKGAPDGRDNETGGGGGGASHVAIAMPQLSTVEGYQLRNYSNTNNRNDILLVAGGGGGSSCQAPGGCGGGTTGGNAKYGSTVGNWQNGTVSDQVGLGGPAASSGSGNFGYGEDGVEIHSNGSGGGGGGYYGGYRATADIDGRRNSGGGGSGFLNDDLLYPYASKTTIDGEHEMPNPNGGTMIGKTDNGYVRITLFGIQTCSARKDVTVNVRQAEVSLNTISDQTICNGGDGVQLTADPSSGVGSPAYQYAWSPATGLSATNVSQVTANPTTTQTYTYKVTATLNGNNSCTASAYNSVSVTVNTAPTAPTSISGSDAVCSGSYVDLSASGGDNGSGATYQWGTGTTVGSNIISGQTSSSIRVTPTGSGTTYWVRRVGNSACTGNTNGVTKAVTVNTAPTAPTSISGSNICLGNNTELTATGGSDGDGSTYQWGTGTTVGENTISGNTSTITVTPTETTTYWVRRVGNTACLNNTDGVTKQITVNTPNPSASGTYDYIWRGGSTDWNAASNWYMYSGGNYSVASSIPATAKNYYIGTGDCLPSDQWPTLSADATVGNVTINGGSVIVPANKTLSIAGSVTGTLNAQDNSTIAFVGSDDQTLSDAATFSNVTVAQTASGKKIIAPNGITVNGLATFGTGVVLGDVSFSGSASATGASLTSYIDGTVTKTLGSAAFTFPLGSNGVLGEVDVPAATRSGATVSMRFNKSASAHGYTTDEGYPRFWNINDMCSGDGANRFHHVSNAEYWDISSTAAVSGVTFRSMATSDVHFNDTSINQRDVEAIKFALYDGCWKNMGGNASVSGNYYELSVSGVTIPAINRAGLKGSFGSTDDATLLPIELLSFTATCDGRSSLIEWTTATEKNNDYFSLERSDDAINFTEVARVAGAGNSIEPIDYAYNDYGIHGGDNYYRLVQVDYDGTRTVSEVIVANCIEPESDGEPEVLAYPNPFSSELTVVLDNFGNRAATIEVYDMLGKLIYTNKVAAPQNSYETILNLSNLPPTAYTVRVSTNDFVINRNVVKN